MRITRFGTGNTVYNFEAAGVYVQDYRDNFGDGVPRTVRLPGLDGGYDQYGVERAPVEVGTVTVGVTLTAATRAQMDALRAQIRAMTGWGVKRLFRQIDYQSDEQWCYARVNSVEMPQQPAQHTDLRQKVTISFQVADPAWYGQGTESWSWGDGTKWSEKPWGGAGSPFYASGTSTTLIEDVGGNMPTVPRILITPRLGESCTNPKVQRLIDGIVFDEVSYTGTVNALQTLRIDCRRLAVTLAGNDAYANFDYRRGGWFELPPEQNTLRVLFANPTDAADVRIRYFERFI